MREIKFRAKRVDTGGWIYGSLLTPSGDGILNVYEICDCNTGTENRIEIKPETICEFTGKFDSTGKEIYENDIIKCNKNYYIVTWSSLYDGFRCYGKNYNKPTLLSDLHNAKVVDNIFDFLKGG